MRTATDYREITRGGGREEIVVGNAFGRKSGGHRTSLVAQMIKNLPAMWGTVIKNIPANKSTGQDDVSGESYLSKV